MHKPHSVLLKIGALNLIDVHLLTDCLALLGDLSLGFVLL